MLASVNETLSSFKNKYGETRRVLEKYKLEKKENNESFQEVNQKMMMLNEETISYDHAKKAVESNLEE